MNSICSCSLTFARLREYIDALNILFCVCWWLRFVLPASAGDWSFKPPFRMYGWRRDCDPWRLRPLETATPGGHGKEIKSFIQQNKMNNLIRYAKYLLIKSCNLFAGWCAPNNSFRSQFIAICMSTAYSSRPCITRNCRSNPSRCQAARKCTCGHS